MIVLLAIYLLSALFCFFIWLQVFQKDKKLSPQERRVSWVVLIVATIFWPIVVPIAYLEKLSQRRHEPESIFINIHEIETHLNDQSDRIGSENKLVGHDRYKTLD